MTRILEVHKGRSHAARKETAADMERAVRAATLVSLASGPSASSRPLTDALDLLARGVFRAPWLGPDGELVLLAVRSDHRLNAPPLIVPHGASRIAAAESLLGGLDRDDELAKRTNLKLMPSRRRRSGGAPSPGSAMHTRANLSLIGGTS